MAKKFSRLIVNRIIDGIHVVALENVPGVRATKVRCSSGDTPFNPPPKADDLFCPGYIEHDVEVANRLGAKAMEMYNRGEL